MSEYGYSVLYEVKAIAALGHGDYRKGMVYAEKSFDLFPDDYKMSLWQLTAAQSGDLQQFYAINSRCHEVIPDDYTRLQRQVDAVEAYALVKSNQRERGRQLIIKWKDSKNSEYNVSKYWKHYPGGSDVVKNWKEMSGMSN